MRDLLRNFYCIIYGFIKEQRKETSVGGAKIFLLKLYHLFISIFLFLPSLLVVLTIRLLAPFVLIRFGRLITGRIGSLVAHTVVYLRDERNTDNNHRKKYDIFYYFRPVSNYQLLRMWRRILYAPNFTFLIHLIDRLNCRFPGYKKHVVPFAEGRELYKCIFYTEVNVPVFLTRKEERRGEKALKKMGVPIGKPFVCLLARDPAYLNSVFPKDDISYHDFRDVSIENYYLAAQKLAEKGYFVLRMGAKVQKPFVSDNPMIIDYATKFRTDFLDIYLSAKCTFFLSTHSGLDEVPKLFKRPVVQTNIVPLEVIPVAGEVVPLFIPNKIWLKSKNRFLTFFEILNSKLAQMHAAQEYKEFGVELVENNPEELAALALEMEEMIRGVWSTTDEDEELQERFRSIFRVYDPRFELKSRIGREFLRWNKQLLD